MSDIELSDQDLQVLCEMLRREVTSAQFIHDEVGHDPAALTSCLNNLSALGCEIEMVGAGMYRLVHTGLAVWEDYLSYVLRSRPLVVDRVRVYRETASTQDLAKSLAPEQALVLADQQTAGRGRMGRAWHSEPGTCVLMSLVKRVTGRPGSHDFVSMLAGISVVRAVEKLSPNAAARLKWPNDVMVNGRKLAGILIEATAGTYVIGIGLNVRKPGHRDPSINDIAISMADFGPAPDRLRVVVELLDQLGVALRSMDTHRLLDVWRSHAILGQTQTFEHHGQRITGQVLDLDPDHGLIVRRDTGEIVTLPAATTSVVG